jgi:hypothetical protein
MDMVAWYTTAWLDRYVKCQPSAQCKRRAAARLLSDRWRNDRRTGAIDPDGDPNIYSFYYRSRYALRIPGAGRRVCDDMRTGCLSMRPDGLPPDYDYSEDATRPDGD